MGSLQCRIQKKGHWIQIFTVGQRGPLSVHYLVHKPSSGAIMHQLPQLRTHGRCLPKHTPASLQPCPAAPPTQQATDLVSSTSATLPSIQPPFTHRLPPLSPVASLMLSQVLDAHTGLASIATHAKPAAETTQPLNARVYLENAFHLQPKLLLAHPTNSSSRVFNDCPPPHISTIPN